MGVTWGCLLLLYQMDMGPVCARGRWCADGDSAVAGPGAPAPRWRWARASPAAVDGSGARSRSRPHRRLRRRRTSPPRRARRSATRSCPSAPAASAASIRCLRLLAENSWISEVKLCCIFRYYFAVGMLTRRRKFEASGVLLIIDTFSGLWNIGNCVWIRWKLHFRNITSDKIEKTKTFYF